MINYLNKRRWMNHAKMYLVDKMILRVCSCSWMVCAPLNLTSDSILHCNIPWMCLYLIDSMWMWSINFSLPLLIVSEFIFFQYFLVLSNLSVIMLWVVHVKIGVGSLGCFRSRMCIENWNKSYMLFIGEKKSERFGKYTCAFISGSLSALVKLEWVFVQLFYH